MANRNPIRVIKIGGSLLDDSQTPKRISNWLDQQPKMQNVWIVGGGKLVDAVRNWDKEFSLKPETAHWMSIELMDINAQLVSSWFPNWNCTDQLDSLFQSREETELQLQSNQILFVSCWLKDNQQLLPKSWDVTSDSIAATVADSLNASELVLLKSCEPPEMPGIETMIAENFVDRHFANSTRNAKYELRFVNLKKLAL